MKEEKNLAAKWHHIKTEIKKRPLLALRLGLQIEQLEKFLVSTPPTDEVYRIESELLNYRIEKTQQLKAILIDVVGYRKTKIHADKIGVSDTTLRGIIEGTNTTCSFDIISKVELYLNGIAKLKLSFDLNHVDESYLKYKLRETGGTIYDLSQGLARLAHTLQGLNKNTLNEKSFVPLPHQYNPTSPLSALKDFKEDLDEIIRNYQSIVDDFNKD